MKPNMLPSPILIMQIDNNGSDIDDYKNIIVDDPPKIEYNTYKLPHDFAEQLKCKRDEIFSK